MLEDVLAVQSAERLQVLGLALSPRDPQDRGPSIGSLARLGHSWNSPLVAPLARHTGGETSIPPRGGAPAVPLLLPEVSPPLRRMPPGSRHAAGLCRVRSMKALFGLMSRSGDVR